jgi:Regulator of ribonuclease activity B
MSWIYALLIAAGAIALFRVYHSMKHAAANRSSDWDEQLVKNLRAQGGTAFREYEIDFFFGLPTEAACRALESGLVADGCVVDFREATTEGASGYTLRARKVMRVSVPEMQAHSRRYRELARLQEGSYDGWATEGITQPAQENVRLRPKGIPRRF